MNANAVRDLDVAADDGAGADSHVSGDAGGWIDHRGRMNVRLELRLGMEDAQRARVSEVRIFHPQNGDVAIGWRFFAQEDCGGARGVHAWRVTRVCEKRDVAFAGLIETGCARDLDVWLSLNSRARYLRKFV